MNEESPEFKDKKLLEKISKLTNGLVYISETDSIVEAFSDGPVNGDDMTSALTALDTQTPVEEIAFEDFFSRLSQQQDWYSKNEKEKAERFARLQRSIEEDLRSIKVLKFGRVQKTIYVAGISPNNNLLGIKMYSVET
jgi:hypothetical protein